MKYPGFIVIASFVACFQFIRPACAAPLTLSPASRIPAINTSLNATLSNQQALQSKPVVTAYSIGNCITPGGSFTIYGRNFGQRTGKRAVLGGHGISVPLQIISWRQTSINVQLPNNGKIVQGLRYYAGIQKFSSHAWLSNINKSFQICSTLAQPSTLTLTPRVFDRVQMPALQNLPAGHQTAPTQTQRQNIPPVIPGSSIPAMTPALLPPPSVPGLGTNANSPTPPIGAAPSNGGGDSGGYGEGSYGDGDYGTYTPDSSGALIGGGPPSDFLPPSMEETRAQTDPENIEPGEIMVASASMEDAMALAQQAEGMGLRIKSRKKLKSIGMVVSIFRTPQGTTATQALAQLRQSFPKLWVDTNHRFTLQRGDATHNYARKMIRWSFTTPQCAVGTRIGMLDTVINTDISVLRNANIQTKRLIGKKATSAPANHGSSIAALLVGQPNSNFAGLLPTAHLYAAEVFRQRDKHHIDATTERILRGLNWLASQHVHAINLSFGGSRDMLLELAIGQLMRQGVRVIAAAGNHGKTSPPVYPAALQGVIAVTAIDVKSHPYARANQGMYIDFAAPGVDIWLPDDRSGSFKSGTSFAVPFVVAAVAVLQSQASHTENSMQVLQAQALDLGVKGRDPIFGWGLLQTNNLCKQSN